tara:strand:+ start:298 stop:762 length:465 start_codon:yes stop_codon:yes gene_type:complete
MSLDNEHGRTQPNNEKSINPFVTVKGNILVSECCGVEAKYTVSDEYGFDMWDLCPNCLDGASFLEVKEEDFDRDIYLDENDNFEFEGYDNFNFQIVPKCTSIAFAMYCPYCKTVENIEPAKNVEQFEDSTIWSCHECCKFWEIDEEGNIATEEE